MPIVTAATLHTHFYPEVLQEIERNSANCIADVLAAATAEACAYLSRYNTEALLQAPDGNYDALLQQLIKDIAAYKLLLKTQVQSHIERYRLAYTDAIAQLERINTGKLIPDGWPLKQDGFTVYKHSNPKRNNSY